MTKLRRVVVVLAVVALVATMMSVGALSATAAEDTTSQGDEAPLCAPEWFREWHQWWSPDGGWWYFDWYQWCHTSGDGWYRSYDGWDWGPPI